MTTADLEGCLSVGEVAAKLKKTKVTVWNWIKFGVSREGGRVKLASLRVWRYHVVTPDALDAFLTACNPTAIPLPESPTKLAKRLKAEQAAAAVALGGVR